MQQLRPRPFGLENVNYRDFRRPPRSISPPKLSWVGHVASLRGDTLELRRERMSTWQLTRLS